MLIIEFVLLKFIIKILFKKNRKSLIMINKLVTKLINYSLININKKNNENND